MKTAMVAAKAAPIPPDKPGQRALRKGRASIPNQIYLITIVTQDRRPIFSEWIPACEVARATINRDVLGQSRFLAWVLMPDHFHGLLQLGEDAPIQDVVRRFKGNTARNVNHITGQEGALWQPGYHDHALRKEENLRETARYVVANPLRAGLVSRLGAYPFWNAEWL